MHIFIILRRIWNTTDDQILRQSFDRQRQTKTCKQTESVIVFDNIKPLESRESVSRNNFGL